MDDDEEDVFDRTVEWAVEHGITTATFHIMTPYPGTRLHNDLAAAGRITSGDWDLYDTRHVVFRPAKLSPQRLKAGYDRAYRNFYSWRNIGSGALTHPNAKHCAKHFAYAAGWRKFEPLWDLVIKTRRLPLMTPLLECVLSKVCGEAEPRAAPARARGGIDAGDTAAQASSGGLTAATGFSRPQPSL